MRLPWWRRVLAARRAPSGGAVGSRPARRTRRRPRLALPVALLLVLGLAWLAYSRFPDLLTFTKEQTREPEALRPTEYRASSSASGHGAGAAFDGASNRYWAPARTGSGVEQYLQVAFQPPVRLRTLLITSGSSTRAEEFLKQARPAQITVTLVFRDGDRDSKEITLRDQPGGQTFSLRGSDVTSVRLTTDASHGGGPDRRLAIAEVEFFGYR